jgi:hypothetical protein
MPDGTKVQGYGWCTSTHVTNAPAAVYVKSSMDGRLRPSTDPRMFDFYVQTGPYVGKPHYHRCNLCLLDAELLGWHRHRETDERVEATDGLRNALSPTPIT